MGVSPTGRLWSGRYSLTLHGTWRHDKCVASARAEKGGAAEVDHADRGWIYQVYEATPMEFFGKICQLQYNCLDKETPSE